MFDEKEIKEKLENIYDQVRQQDQSVIKRTREKFEDPRMSCISEQSLEHTININRNGSITSTDTRLIKSGNITLRGSLVSNQTGKK